jgi:hypothetical protein
MLEIRKQDATEHRKAGWLVYAVTPLAGQPYDGFATPEEAAAFIPDSHDEPRE